MVAKFNWEVSWHTLEKLFETRRQSGGLEINSCLSSQVSEDPLWRLRMYNDGPIRLSLDCDMMTDHCCPPLFYIMKFGGTKVKPFLDEEGQIYSTMLGPSTGTNFFSYGRSSILVLPISYFRNCKDEFIRNEKLLIDVRVHTMSMYSNPPPQFRDIKQHWNPLKAAFQNDFAKLLGEPKYSDVTIICDGEEIKAHKCILAARSTVFSKMLETDANEIMIPDVSVSTMKLVLQYIYTDQGDSDLLEDRLHEVLQCAEKYDLKDLKTLCSNKINYNQTVFSNW
ncbi:Protein roadkill [Pseudolycoriella hygida]|uniref:Protein roadkill n=1 Tax=Pseudolycoriella hygida TaxID=35572 RepID=A0A9Q0N0T6_9DIPT|nr:Protein roadkill [Pseudolycoriella hygida]